MKKEINQNDYLKLVGLFSLAQYHNKAIRDIEKAAAEIIEAKDEGNYYGYLSDALWGFDETTPDDMLKNSGIVVKKEKPNAKRRK